MNGCFAVVRGCCGGIVGPACDFGFTVGVDKRGANKSVVEFGLAAGAVAFGVDGGGNAGPSCTVVAGAFFTSTDVSPSFAFVELIQMASEQHAPIAASRAILFQR